MWPQHTVWVEFFSSLVLHCFPIQRLITVTSNNEGVQAESLSISCSDRGCVSSYTQAEQITGLSVRSFTYKNHLFRIDLEETFNGELR